MAKHGKKYRKLEETKAAGALPITQAIEAALNQSYAKFDESFDVAFRLGVDAKQSDQQLRSAVVLPHGSGKSARVIVFARGDKMAEAEKAGADLVGADDLVQKIQGGWLEFDSAVATPDMMAVVSKVGKILGPRGLMPNPKLGTVTFDVTKAVQELKKGKAEFRTEKAGIIHCSIGKKSMGAEKLSDNFKALGSLIMKMKPSTAKGVYLRNITVSTTMGLAATVDATEVGKL